MTVAKDLNKASDELNQVIKLYEDQLQFLNVGVSAWITIARGKDWANELGYIKFNKSWGLALRRTETNPDLTTDEQTWKIYDGPRYLRCDAVPHFPELLDALVKRSQAFIELTQKRISEVKEFLQEE